MAPSPEEKEPAEPIHNQRCSMSEAWRTVKLDEVRFKFTSLLFYTPISSSP
jgi:hypothetical protein